MQDHIAQVDFDISLLAKPMFNMKLQCLIHSKTVLHDERKLLWDDELCQVHCFPLLLEELEVLQTEGQGVLNFWANLHLIHC